MKISKRNAISFLGLAAVSATQAVQAQDQAAAIVGQQGEIPNAITVPDPVKLKKLKIMLMVSSLWCRHGADDFRPAYNRFAIRHRVILNKAHGDMKSSMVAKYGSATGRKNLDRVTVSMANEYGQGHPWLSCKELGQITTDLAEYGTRIEVLAAANHLLGSAPVSKPSVVVAAR